MGLKKISYKTVLLFFRLSRFPTNEHKKEGFSHFVGLYRYWVLCCSRRLLFLMESTPFMLRVVR